jgi:hypothetical protein
MRDAISGNAGAIKLTQCPVRQSNSDSTCSVPASCRLRTPCHAQKGPDVRRTTLRYELPSGVLRCRKCGWRIWGTCGQGRYDQEARQPFGMLQLVPPTQGETTDEAGVDEATTHHQWIVNQIMKGRFPFYAVGEPLRCQLPQSRLEFFPWDCRPRFRGDLINWNLGIFRGTTTAHPGVSPAGDRAVGAARTPKALVREFELMAPVVLKPKR